MRPTRGPIILPEKPLRRFRLPDMPEEPQPRATGRMPWRTLMIALAWLAVTGTCLAFTESELPSISVASQPEPGPDPIAVVEARRRAAAQERPTPDRASTPKAPVRRVASTRLSSLRRRVPAPHSGNRLGFAGWQAPPMDDGSWSESSAPDFDAVSIPRAPSTERPQRSSPSGSKPGVGSVQAASAPISTAEGDRSRSDRRPVVADTAHEPQRTWTATRMQGCEQAAAENVEELNMAEVQQADVPRQAYARQLEDFGRYARCDLNHEMNVSICVAVRAGKARGVTVRTQPANARVADCVAAAVASMSFPNSARMDVVRTELIVR